MLLPLKMDLLLPLSRGLFGFTLSRQLLSEVEEHGVHAFVLLDEKASCIMDFHGEKNFFFVFLFICLLLRRQFPFLAFATCEAS